MGKKTVAIIGASADRTKFGNKAVRAYKDVGWEVYPVNPKGGTIEGLPVVRDIRQVPKPLDRVSVYLRPAIGLTVLGDIAVASPHEVYLNPGTADTALLEKARALQLPIIEACSIVAIGRSPSQYY